MLAFYIPDRLKMYAMRFTILWAIFLTVVVAVFLHLQLSYSYKRHTYRSILPKTTVIDRTQFIRGKDKIGEESVLRLGEKDVVFNGQMERNQTMVNKQANLSDKESSQFIRGKDITGVSASLRLGEKDTVLKEQLERNQTMVNSQANLPDNKQSSILDDGNDQLIADTYDVQPKKIKDATAVGAVVQDNTSQAVGNETSALSAEQTLIADTEWANFGFNKTVSDLIPINRTLPDLRDQRCATLDYGATLPDACVVIVFHNEAWSVLMRTLHSILNRSESNYLKEVILVDDFSTAEDLLSPLQDYVNRLSKVKLLRATERLGVIRARLLGFEQCTAQVAIFFDSNCEASEGWFLPLLARIQGNQSRVFVPDVDLIDPATFEYRVKPDGPWVGGFDWSLHTIWTHIQQGEWIRIKNETTVPVRSPTIPDSIFAVDRNYFRHIGLYDKNMSLSGGENLELSFRIWMCGGTVEMVPCSHVGHVLRSGKSQTESEAESLRWNLERTAEVWMDEYKQYFYNRTGGYRRFNSSVEDRLTLRKNLKCKPFKWYLTELMPSSFIPEKTVVSGEIRHTETVMCINGEIPVKRLKSQDEEIKTPNVGVQPCSGTGGSQYWEQSLAQQMKRDNSCWTTPDGTQIRVSPCSGGGNQQQFIYKQDGSIFNPLHKKCVEMSSGNQLLLKDCNGSSNQTWYMGTSIAKPPIKQTLRLQSNDEYTVKTR